MRKYLFLPFILLLFAVFTHAHAEDLPANKIYRTGSQSAFYSTPEASCQALTGMTGWTYQSVVQAGNYPQQPFWHCRWTNNSTGNTSSQGNVLEEYNCNGLGGTLSPTYQGYPRVCQGVPPCPEGHERQPDGSCLPPPRCDPGQIVSSGYYDIGTVPTSSMPPGGCHRGCVTSPVGDSPVGRQLINGVYHYFAKGHYETTSIRCQTPGSLEPGLGAIPGPTCGSGQVMGNNGGKATCSAPKPGDPNVPGTPANPHTPDTPKAPEETKEEKQPPVTNPDGSTSQTTTTTYPDGSTKSETTTTKADGSTTTTTTTTAAPKDPTKTEDPIKDFCKSNPNNKLCKETDERSWGKPDGVGHDFDIPAKEEEIEQKKDEFKNLLQQIRGEIENLLNWNGAGSGGQLGCSGSVQVLGASFQICLGQYSEQLSQIASGLVFLSLLIALFIILA